MPFTFSGFFILDVLLLAFILLIPIPTTPFLIYLILNLPIIKFAFLYLLASNLYVSLLYFCGFHLNSFNFKRYLTALNISTENLRIIKLKAWRIKARQFATEKLKNISIWNIIVIRTVAIHPTIVSFGSGMVKGSFFNNIIANSILAIIDVLFYWVLLGSGKIIFIKIFPNVDIEYYLTEYFFQAITISLIVFYLIFFTVKLYKYIKINKS